MRILKTNTNLIVMSLLLLIAASCTSYDKRAEEESEVSFHSSNTLSVKMKNENFQKQILRSKEEDYQQEKNEIKNQLDNIRKVADENKNFLAHIPLLDSLLKVKEKQYGKVSEIVAMIQNRKAYMYFKGNDYNSAIDCYEKKEQIYNEIYLPSNPGVAKVKHTLGDCYRKLSAYRKAERYHLEASNLRRQYKDPKLNKTLNQLGNTYENIGDYHKALKYYNEALDYSYKDTLSIALLHHNIGILHSQLKEFGKALLHFNKALDIYTVWKFVGKIATCYEMIATTCMEKKSYQNARDNFNAAMKIYRANKMEIPADLYNNLGIYFLETNELDSAALCFRKALSLKKALYKTAFHSNISSTYINLGDYEKMRNNYVRANQFYDKAITCHLQFKTTKVENFHSSKIIGQKQHLLEAFTSKAASYLNMTTKADSLAAEETLSMAIDLIDRIRQEQTEDKIKLLWMEKFETVYENAIALSYELKQPQKLFGYIEKRKAVLLVDELQNKAAENLLPDSLLATEQFLKDKITGLSHSLEKNPDNEKTHEKLLKEQEKLRKLVLNLEDKFPDYYAAKYNAEYASVLDIQAHLNENGGTLIAYAISDKFIYSVVIDAVKLAYCRIQKPDDFEERVEDFVNVVANKNAADTHKELNVFLDNSCSLFDLLIGPLSLKNKERLIIIPDDILNYMPFEILLSDTGPKNPHWLLLEHPISYTYAATILLQNCKKKKTGNGRGLFVAPVTFSDRTSPELKMSLEEVTEIASIYEGDKLLRSDATMDNFKNKAEAYSILHLSTHGNANSNNNKIPYIALGDGKLKLSDIYNLRLKAELVTLSACETSRGDLKIGEGVMSIARAFTWAGTPSTVTTLWKVQEEPTKEIFTLFYENLSKGMTKDMALQEAKITYIKANEKNLFPYYWAALTVVGNVDAVLY